MDQKKRQAVALMRYSAIAPLITGLSDDFKSLTAFFNNASIKGVTHPDGTVKHYAPGTIEKWYRNYKDDGFDALIPTGRRDQGKPRKLDEDLQQQIKYLKSNYPRMSASAIYRQLRDNGSIKNGFDGDGQLHHAQIGRQMAAGLRHRGNNEITDLRCQSRALGIGQLGKIRMSPNRR